MNSAIAKGKYEHTDANVIRNVEVQGLTLDNDRERVGKAHYGEALMEK